MGQRTVTYPEIGRSFRICYDFKRSIAENPTGKHLEGYYHHRFPSYRKKIAGAVAFCNSPV
jgi:hypothetical protein